MKPRTHGDADPETKVGDVVRVDEERRIVTKVEQTRRPRADGKGDFGFVLVFTEEMA